MPYCYILFSDKLNRYYFGSTNGTVEERLKKHLHRHNGFTARANDWKVVYAEYFDSLTNAIKRELQVKAWKSRKKVLELVRKSP
jgi:putative endonuclease